MNELLLTNMIKKKIDGLCVRFQHSKDALKILNDYPHYQIRSNCMDSCHQSFLIVLPLLLQSFFVLFYTDCLALLSPKCKFFIRILFC